MSFETIKKSNEDLVEEPLKDKKSLNLSKKKIQKYNFKGISKLASNSLKQNNSTETYIDISEAIISFLSLSKRKNSRDIYLGRNNIGFKELDIEFKTILKQEFEDAIKNLK
ncbi:MAG: hypothetical protein ACFFAN_07590 [Promethearchaeota archaeon]